MTTGLEAVPTDPVPAVVAIGANLGDRGQTLLAALDALRGSDGVMVAAVGPVVETDPVGGPEQPDFLNTVVLVDTVLSPRALLATCHRIEADHARRRDVRWGPRTLDLDLIDHDGLVAADVQLTLPHPRAHERAFVLNPWAAVDPDAVLPGPNGGPVRDLLAVAADRDGVRPPSVPVPGWPT